MLKALSLAPAILFVFQGLRSYGLPDPLAAAGGFIALALPLLIVNFDIEVGVGIKFVSPSQNVEEQING